MGVRIVAYRVFVKKPECRRQLERPSRRWKDNIEIHLCEVGWGHGLDRPAFRIRTGDGLL
jgi:hypothetical protein